MGRMPLRDGDPARIGQYRLTARLGAGGMGVVYLGAVKGGGQAAIKVLRPELADDHEFRTRFRREVAVLARVQGLCTVRVIEADTESAKPYLATEYAEGPSLSEHVAACGPLPPQMLHGLAAGLAEALVAIHAAGVVHRDLKPGNVLLTQAGPKVIDFGIAQAMDATAVTRTGMMVGSPGYMAPEQITGQAGPPADVFSWGLTVAYAASGQLPFGTGPTDAVIYRILHDNPDISAVPAELRPAVEAALAKSPASRPVARDLLGWLTSQTGQPDATGQPDVTADSQTQQLLARTWLLPAPQRAAIADSRRHRIPSLILAGAAALAVVIVAGAGYLASASSRASSAPPVAGSSPGRTPLPAPSPSAPHPASRPSQAAPVGLTSPAPPPTFTCVVRTGDNKWDYRLETTTGLAYASTVDITFTDAYGHTFPPTLLRQVEAAGSPANWHPVPAVDIGASAEPSACSAQAASVRTAGPELNAIAAMRDAEKAVGSCLLQAWSNAGYNNAFDQYMGGGNVEFETGTQSHPTGVDAADTAIYVHVYSDHRVENNGALDYWGCPPNKFHPRGGIP